MNNVAGRYLSPSHIFNPAEIKKAKAIAEKAAAETRELARKASPEAIYTSGRAPIKAIEVSNNVPKAADIKHIDFFG